MKLEKAQEASLGSCLPLFDDSGQIKEEFKDEVENLEVDAVKASSFVPRTKENFKTAQDPSRFAPKGYKRKVPIGLSAKMSKSIQRLGNCFSTDDMMRVRVNGLERGVGFNYKGSLSTDKLSLDIDFTILDKRRLFIIADFTMSSPSFFFQQLNRNPGPGCSRRMLQELSTENQQLIDNTPLVSNETFSAKFLAHDYDQKGVDITKFLGLLLRIIYYLAVLSTNLRHDADPCLEV